MNFGFGVTLGVYVLLGLMLASIKFYNKAAKSEHIDTPTPHGVGF